MISPYTHILEAQVAVLSNLHLFNDWMVRFWGDGGFVPSAICNRCLPILLTSIYLSTLTLDPSEPPAQKNGPLAPRHSTRPFSQCV